MINITIRDRNTIVDKIYETGSSYIDLKMAKRFDLIDVVFIDGDCSLFPWDYKMHRVSFNSPWIISKILIFLRMCLKTKKRIFASGFAMQAMIFLVASNVERIIRVINGEGKGAPVDETQLTTMNDGV